MILLLLHLQLLQLLSLIRHLLYSLLENRRFVENYIFGGFELECSGVELSGNVLTSMVEFSCLFLGYVELGLETDVGGFEDFYFFHETLYLLV